jgi:hypothetical protein
MQELWLQISGHQLATGGSAAAVTLEMAAFKRIKQSRPNLTASLLVKLAAGTAKRCAHRGELARCGETQLRDSYDRNHRNKAYEKTVFNQRGTFLILAEGIDQLQTLEHELPLQTRPLDCQLSSSKPGNPVRIILLKLIRVTTPSLKSPHQP